MRITRLATSFTESTALTIQEGAEVYAPTEASGILASGMQETKTTVFEEADVVVVPTAEKAKGRGWQERVKVLREQKQPEPRRPARVVYMDDIAYIEEIPGPAAGAAHQGCSAAT